MQEPDLRPSWSQAAADNAAWCAAVWTSLGIASRYEDGFLVADGRTPAGFPELVTLTRGLDPTRIARVLVDLDPGGTAGLSVKDSFADLALDTVGFRVLLDGAWIVRAAEPPADDSRSSPWQIVTDADAVAAWATGRDTAPAFGPRLLDQDTVRLVSHRDLPGTGFALTVGPQVVGVSNVRAGGLDLDELWTGVVTTCARLAPGHGLVGWELPDDLAAPLRAGFAVAGPLRVWMS